jgi:hypothetical protein
MKITANNKLKTNSDKVLIALCVGHLDSFEKVVEVSTLHKHLRLVKGWEMKDVLDIPLPDRVKYLMLKDIIHVNKKGIDGYILFCR